MGTSSRPSKPPRSDGRAPAGYDPTEFPVFAVTVDIVILTVIDGQLHVLLVRRDADPFEGAWALPGGFKKPDETLDQAARRELREETGVRAPKHLAQFGAYGDPGRDPRTNVVTVGYLAVTPEVGTIMAGSDAADARLWLVKNALRGIRLAFDHRKILRDAVARAADDLGESDLATAFVGPTFTLSELQSVYEALWGDELDPANFRRSLSPPMEASYVEPTGQRASAGPRGGRPPELFRASDAWDAGSPVRRNRKKPGVTRRRPTEKTDETPSDD